MQAMLNDKPVTLGTLLEFLPEEKSDPDNLLPEYVTVVDITATMIEYEGEGVEGECRIDQLHKRFKHHEFAEEKLAMAYPLEHITDLLNVPDERLDACLDEMKNMIRQMRAAVEPALAANEKEHNITLTRSQRRLYIRTVIPRVVWIDDDETYLKFNVQ